MRDETTWRIIELLASGWIAVMIIFIFCCIGKWALGEVVNHASNRADLYGSRVNFRNGSSVYTRRAAHYARKRTRAQR